MRQKSISEAVLDNSKYLEELTQIILSQAEMLDSLTKCEFKYKSTQRLVLETGQGFTQIINNSAFKGRPKLCYQNCFEMILKHPDLYYCEGFAVTEYIGLVVDHAWLVNGDGQVIDPTWWDKTKFTNGTYYGIIFNKNFVLETAKLTKVYGILGSDYLLEDKLKKFGIPEAALHRL